MNRCTSEDRPLECDVADFLADLTHAHRSPHTRRAYATDLAKLSTFHQGSLQHLTVDVLRALFATYSHLSPASCARMQATIASFLNWAYRQGLIDANPMTRIARVQLPGPTPRGLRREQVEVILAKIPVRRRRDRVLFRLIFETGLRVSEALGLYVEDLDLRRDDEHITVNGKGGQRRTVLLDAPDLVRQLRAYLAFTGYTRGPLFRAEKNGRGERYGTNRCKNGGQATAPRQRFTARSTNFATVMRQNWSIKG